MRHSGVVVEIGPKNQVIILTSQGEFIKVPFKKHVQVGQEIRYTPKRERLNVWQLGLAATLFLALVGTWPMISGSLIPTSIAPAFIITLDINPSIELQISDAQKVLSVEGLNRDGKDLVARLDVVGDALKPALTKITNQAKTMGYIKQGQNEVVVTIASQKSQNAKLVESKNPGSGVGEHAEIERAIAEAFVGTQLAQVRVWQVPRSLQTEAKLAGIIPSRYIAIQMPANNVPASPVIPQRPETRLTMNEVPEVGEDSSSLSRTTSLQANVEAVRPALTPARWTKENTSTVTRTDLYNMDFSVAAIKGDL
ncbi:MAG: anti-sigma factor domain-containing protein [Firmicutes bacterium]|nr:anti-sigma factor domain-containing protein [Bacillota bacterium]